MPAASPWRGSATNRRTSPTGVDGARATKSHTIGYAARARMITLPDPSRPPHHGAIDAPIRLVMPKAANSSPYVYAVNPSDRRARSESTVIAAPLARNQTWVDAANGPSERCRYVQ